MIDTLLINPPLFKSKGSIWKAIGPCFPALGLASIAAYIRENGFEVKIIDLPALDISQEKFEDYLRGHHIQDNPRYVGFTAMTCAVKKAYDFAEIVKKVFPKTKIVFGGVHATIDPEEILSHDFVDIVVRGEGEITYSEILTGEKLSKIKGIVYRKNQKIIFNKEQERISNLDELPFPAYDLLPMEKYRPSKGTYERLPAISMIAGRGCPGKCTFCYKTLGNKIIYRTAESLIGEIKFLQKKFGIKQIMFYDDTFTTFKQNVKRFCGLLLSEKIDISWCCFSRIDFVDLELLKLMRKAGCHQIMYGIESGSQEILKRINKKLNLDLARKVIKWTKLAGIDVRGAFMLGNPGETKKSLLKTLNLAVNLNLELAIFNITTPFPGTKMFEEESAKGNILTYDWDDYDFSVPILKLENLTNNELKEYYRYCYKRFYLRPGYLFSRFVRIFKKPKEFLLLFQAFKSFFSFLEE